MSCDPNQVAFDAAQFQSIPPGNIPSVVTYLLCKIANMNCDPEQLQRDASCFNCIEVGRLAYIQTYLLCQILANGGGGGGESCLLCGVQNPNIAGVVPKCDCAVYYNKLTREFWDWTGTTWEPFIAEP